MKYFDRLFVILVTFMFISLLGMVIVNTEYIKATKLLLIFGCAGMVLTLVVMWLSVLIRGVIDGISKAYQVYKLLKDKNDYGNDSTGS